MSLGLEDGVTSQYEDPIERLLRWRRTCSSPLVQGNDGPIPKSLGNSSPRTLVVAAGSIDRGFRVELHLGNRVSVSGQNGQVPVVWS
ncbi:unnamed protein product [Linum trigynum]|uniref:Uncharacterized protein n=1 Tax=Linum trigynum TaxID=586398 RepID=A0AAV2ELT6_9ROSI